MGVGSTLAVLGVAALVLFATSATLPLFLLTALVWATALWAWRRSYRVIESIAVLAFFALLVQPLIAQVIRTFNLIHRVVGDVWHSATMSEGGGLVPLFTFIVLTFVLAYGPWRGVIDILFAVLEWLLAPVVDALGCLILSFAPPPPTRPTHQPTQEQPPQQQQQQALPQQDTATISPPSCGRCGTVLSLELGWPKYCLECGAATPDQPPAFGETTRLAEPVT